jgi:bifunctional DNA-binding transcriptional regulator/antitoxin component of YhaV-PrlF toxin-antitoxin module
MTQLIYTKLGEDRRIAIPAKTCKRLGLAAGDFLVLEEEGESLRLISSSQILREVQAAFAPYRREGVSEVDELIAERRAEAAREDSRGE